MYSRGGNTERQNLNRQNWHLAPFFRLQLPTATKAPSHFNYEQQTIENCAQADGVMVGASDSTSRDCRFDYGAVPLSCKNSLASHS